MMYNDVDRNVALGTTENFKVNPNACDCFFCTTEDCRCDILEGRGQIVLPDGHSMEEYSRAYVIPRLWEKEIPRIVASRMTGCAPEFDTKIEFPIAFCPMCGRKL